MPSPNAQQILVGAAQLYFGANESGFGVVAPPAPVDTEDYLATMDTEVATAESPWKYAGYTQEGVEVAYEPDYGEVEADQAKAPVVMFNQGLTISMNTNLLEATLENLLVAWGGQPSDLVGGRFTLGDPADQPIERTLVVVGNAPRQLMVDNEDALGVQRVYTAWRCISVEGSTHALRRTEATVFPVSFRLMPVTAADLVAATLTADTTAGAGDGDFAHADAHGQGRAHYGKILDRVWEAAP